MIATGNALKAAAFYLNSQKSTYKQNLNKYILDELLGGLTGTCKKHTAEFFNEITQGKFWAIESSILSFFEIKIEIFKLRLVY